MVQVHRIELAKSLFQGMPENERTLLFLLGHVSNELNVFNKALLAAIQTGNERLESAVTFVHASQCLIILRDFIGKLHEARVMYQARDNADRSVRAKLNNRLPNHARQMEKDLSKLMDGGILARVRNKFSFHYGDKGNNIEAAFRSIPASEPWLALLSRHNGNTFFHFAEMVVQTAILREVCEQNEGEAFDAWLHRAFSELTQVAVNSATLTMSLYMEVMSALTEDYFPQAKSAVEEIPAIRLKDIRLTFFTEK